jgi:hypothetical protein
MGKKSPAAKARAKAKKAEMKAVAPQVAAAAVKEVKKEVKKEVAAAKPAKPQTKEIKISGKGSYVGDAVGAIGNSIMPGMGDVGKGLLSVFGLGKYVAGVRGQGKYSTTSSRHNAFNEYAKGMKAVDIGAQLVAGRKVPGFTEFPAAMLKLLESHGAELYQGQEMVCEVWSSDTTDKFRNNILLLNPGLPDSFPMAANIAKNYQSYLCDGLYYCFEPDAGVAISSSAEIVPQGYVALGVNYDPTKPAYKSFDEIMNTDGVVSGLPTQTLWCGVECDPSIEGEVQKYVMTADSTAADGTGATRQQLDGILNIVTCGQPNATPVKLGLIRCCYRFIFWDRVKQLDATFAASRYVALRYVNSATFSPANPAGVADADSIDPLSDFVSEPESWNGLVTYGYQNYAEPSYLYSATTYYPTLICKMAGVFKIDIITTCDTVNAGSITGSGDFMVVDAQTKQDVAVEMIPVLALPSAVGWIDKKTAIATNALVRTVWIHASGPWTLYEANATAAAAGDWCQVCFLTKYPAAWLVGSPVAPVPGLVQGRSGTRWVVETGDTPYGLGRVVVKRPPSQRPVDVEPAVEIITVYGNGVITAQPVSEDDATGASSSAQAPPLPEDNTRATTPEDLGGLDGSSPSAMNGTEKYAAAYKAARDRARSARSIAVMNPAQAQELDDAMAGLARITAAGPSGPGFTSNRYGVFPAPTPGKGGK